MQGYPSVYLKRIETPYGTIDIEGLAGVKIVENTPITVWGEIRNLNLDDTFYYSFQNIVYRDVKEKNYGIYCEDYIWIAGRDSVEVSCSFVMPSENVHLEFGSSACGWEIPWIRDCGYEYPDFDRIVIEYEPEKPVDIKPELTYFEPTYEAEPGTRVLAYFAKVWNNSDYFTEFYISLTDIGKDIVLQEEYVDFMPGETKSFGYELIMPDYDLNLRFGVSWHPEAGVYKNPVIKEWTLKAVTPPPVGPKLVPTEPTPSVDTIRLGDSVIISYSVINQGDQYGCWSFTLTMNGETVCTKEVCLSPGQTTSVDCTFTPKEAKDYSANINGYSFPVILRVLPAPTEYATIKGTVIDAKTEEPIEGVLIIIDGVPDGETDAEGRFSIDILVGTIPEILFEKEGYYETHLPPELIPTEPGEVSYVTIRLNPIEAVPGKTVAKVMLVRVEPEQIDVGESVDVYYRVTNVGELAGDILVQVYDRDFDRTTGWGAHTLNSGQHAEGIITLPSDWFEKEMKRTFDLFAGAVPLTYPGDSYVTFNVQVGKPKPPYWLLIPAGALLLYLATREEE